MCSQDFQRFKEFLGFIDWPIFFTKDFIVIISTILIFLVFCFILAVCCISSTEKELAKSRPEIIYKIDPDSDVFGVGKKYFKKFYEDWE